MRFRAGFCIGLGVGYVLGAKAGRERYEEIVGWWNQIAGSERFQTVASKGRAVVDLSAGRVRNKVSQGFDAASQKVRDVAEQPLSDD
ncbi:MAG: hypothetical protein ACE5KX_05795 [Acidimicrobiia bacterium]